MSTRFEDPGEEWRELNRAWWDERVPLHLGSDLYDIPAFRAGADPLPAEQLAELGDVTGKRLLHLQCHIGTDTLAWARHGATVTGLDFSAPAIAAARSLAADIGITDARFVAADIYDAPEALAGERYDIVYTGTGALCWLPHIRPWAEVVARLLAPGGTFYLFEAHPFGETLDFADGNRIGEDYFAAARFEDDATGSYADTGADTRHNSIASLEHGLGEVVSALTAVGLRIDFLHEHDFALWPANKALRAEPGGRYRFPPGMPRVPLTYSLRASVRLP